ncbi:hypothetical protein N7486_002968 [Penicillium sp. IBT 16267x]|nr:hypothetical protein N7486_002968 [Penicillium sp. IBT 16267x]
MPIDTPHLRGIAFLVGLYEDHYNTSLGRSPYDTVRRSTAHPRIPSDASQAGSPSTPNLLSPISLRNLANHSPGAGPAVRARSSATILQYSAK